MSVESNPSAELAGWNLESTYSRLPSTLHEKVAPAKVPTPKLVVFNYELADSLGLDFSDSSTEDLASLFSGQILPEKASSIAQAYAGHQFGGFTMLGDGRAIMLGEQRTPSGDLFDLQFKGSGETPFSRRGDGKAALGPMLREYIIGESMAALGIPTTRSLCVVETGERVFRETALKGAILTRVASSHIRVGTFQFLAAKQDIDSLRELADYTISRHYPDFDQISGREKYTAFLKGVIDRQALLIAKWQLVGFIHGVMNTDNMLLCGETVDYGPCAFMDNYDPETVFSSIDHGGRYAYHNQPSIALWNLARFAETLLPLFEAEQEQAIEVATEILHTFSDIFDKYWKSGMRAKLGLLEPDESDEKLINTLLAWMQKRKADFTNTFDDLATGVDKEVYQDAEFQDWKSQWEKRVLEHSDSLDAARQAMLAANPAVIPRNHRVEEALSAATIDADLGPFKKLMEVLSVPFERSPQTEEFREPPPSGTCYRTFCGT